MPTKRFQIYKCPVCDTMVEIIDEVGMELVCCGPPMVCLGEQTDQPGSDEHRPRLIREDGGLKVAVGESAHPMDEDHHISWIEVFADGQVIRRYLGPGQPAEAHFPISPDRALARCYCNRHGLWKGAIQKDVLDQDTRNNLAAPWGAS